MNDEREGRVSASRFEILALCPGSEQLRRTLPPEALESGDEWTDRGQKLHRAFEDDNTFALDAEDVPIYQNAINTDKDLVAQWCEDFGITSYQEGPREERLWLHDDSTLKPLTSAQLDRHYVSIEPAGFVLSDDLKSLWSPNLTPAEVNYQGRVQAVVAAKEYGARHVRMAFNKAMFATADIADYNADALWRAEFSIRQAIWESEQKGATLRAGEHCLHCACKAHCPTALRYAMTPIPSLQIVPVENGKLTEKRVTEMVKAAPIEAVREVFGKRNVVKYIMEAVKARLASLPEDEKYRLALKMGLGRSTDYVRDVKGAVESLIAGGFPEDQVWGTLSMSKADVVAMVERFRNCRGSEAETFFEVQMDEYIERGRGNPILAEA